MRAVLGGGWMLACLCALTGCQSTSPLAKLFTRDSGTNSKDDIAWKRSGNAPSSAMAQERWTNPPKQEEPVRMTAFQDPPKKDWMPPPPELMLKPDGGAPIVVGPVVMPKHGGRHHGKAPLPLPNAPNELTPVSLPSYVIRPPDVLLIELLPQFSRDENLKLKIAAIGLLNQPVFGQHLVRPDGTVELGVYGAVPVAGRTVQEARIEVAKVIYGRLDQKKAKLEDVLDNLKVDVLTYNSSVYYVITDGAGLGQQVYRFPVTGHETVLDAISHINGLPIVASPKRIWVARKNPGHAGPDSILPVDWKGISQQGVGATNWQLMPGDRVFVQSDPMRRFNTNLGKMLEPIERLFGATLLGGQTVNTIRNGTNAIR
ncbi:MAG: polysaccharide biosynthesis/export family protein [Planctomycetes bacterium]|nr:polysaccharide biosynthesis/export family protein [Planctomycetota bacterium]